MASQLYPERAYRNWLEPSLASARQIVPFVMDFVSPRSVVDVGCGLGMWGSVFLENGVETLQGIDNITVPKDSLVIPPDSFMTHDLAQPLSLGTRFDLVVSLEVAEHLPESSAATFVETLTSLGPVVLFSAAVPHQRGRGHINEQWPSYWAELFAKRGYRAVDCVRKRIWTDERVEPYYTQNMLIYVDAGRLDRYPKLAAEALREGELPLSLIHPFYYTIRSDWANSSVKRHGQILMHYVRAVLRRVGLTRQHGDPAKNTP